MLIVAALVDGESPEERTPSYVGLSALSVYQMGMRAFIQDRMSMIVPQLKVLNDNVENIWSSRLLIEPFFKIS